MMFCPNSRNQMNPSNDNLIRLNGWSQVVPICMPWANSTVTPTTAPTPTPTTPITTLMNELEVNRNVIQFTANTQPINMSVNPVITQLNGPMNASVLPMAFPTRIVENESTVKTNELCPDPCTSQTATRWELLHNISTGSHSSHQHLKRRNDSSDEELEEELRSPVKQHISEDKVSAIFNRLQITNNDIFDEKIDCEESDDGSNELKNPIIFADELQTAIKSKTITDLVMQNELNKHSKAVVLWQPISPLYPPIGQNSDSNEELSDKSESDFSVNQNNANNSSDLDIDFNDFDNEMELCL